MTERTLARTFALPCKSVIRGFQRQQVLSCRTYTSFGTQASNVSTLSWREYLALRSSKRKWQVAATIPCAILGFVGGAVYFGNLDTDPSKMIMGIDPFFFYGFCTVGCVGAGILIGPTIGTTIWRMSHRQSLALIDAKDAEFYQRIAKNRVDAALQSPTSPIPDYYGERIGSMRDYRRWLKDQAKYKRKAILDEK